MIKIDSEQIHLDNNKHGTYVFIVKDCYLCREYLRELKHNNVDTRKWYLINCSDDEDYYLDMEHMDSMPTTRIYNENVVMLEKQGVLYETQLKEVTEYK
jgi:hypothetical protein